MASVKARSIIRKTTRAYNRPKAIKTVKSGMSKNVMDTKVQGIGTYTKSNKFSSLTGKRTIEGLRRGQAYRLEKDALSAQKMKISTKPELIKALGQAVAMNTTGAQGGLALGITEKFKQSFSPQQTPTSPQGSINTLIGGGANLATKDNDEEKQNDTNENGDFSFLR